KYFHIGDSISVRIIAVVADIRDHSLVGRTSRRAYFPYVHHDPQQGTPVALRFEIRTAGDPAALTQQVRKTILTANPQLRIDSMDPLEHLMAPAIAQARLVAQLATAFGTLALLLAAIGLYGVMSYAVARRTGEIGVRVALGAQQADVLRMVLLDALRLVVA